MKTILFNPFLKTAGSKALLIGLVFVIVSSILAFYFQTHFDGVLDVHFGEINQWWIPFVENGINILSLFLIFYILGAILTKGRVRWIDILGTTVLARFPLIIMPFGNAGNFVQDLGESIAKDPTHLSEIQFGAGEIIFLILFIILSMCVLIWYVALLFNAYKISTNLKKGTLVVSFICGLLLAEIVSKIMIYTLLI